MSWMSGRGGRAAGTTAVITLSLLFMAPAWGYEQYSQNGDATNCRACHGDFRASFYTEKGLDGGYWFDGLHVSHQNFVESECDTCHGSGPRFPVLLDSSVGAPGLSPIACTGCHGRDADSTLPGSPTVTLGAGAGLRQHHWNADDDHPTMNLKVCADCHADADPAAFTPAGEASLPTYYAEAGAAYPNLPVDPCDGASPLEDQYGDTVTGGADGRGTDNDGDRLYELADPDCTASPVAPGEAAGLAIAPLQVTAYDGVTGTMDISYGVPCSATDHSLAWGNLSFQSAPTYDYVGELCSIGATGTLAGWSYPAQSFFFLVVANDAATVEGSYGLSSSGVERAVNAACGLAQDLANRCD
ncbi:MAG: hypothetical protein PVF68_11025 [Acidobacteriota bacterium]